MLSERGCAAMCTAFGGLARSVCGGKLVLLLEGGYSLEGLSRSVHACVEVMAGQARDDFPQGVSREAATALRDSREALKSYWPMLGR